MAGTLVASSVFDQFSCGKSGAGLVFYAVNAALWWVIVPTSATTLASFHASSLTGPWTAGATYTFGTSIVAGGDVGLAYASVAGDDVVQVTYNPSTSTHVFQVRGTISGTTLTWGTENTIATGAGTISAAPSGGRGVVAVFDSAARPFFLSSGLGAGNPDGARGNNADTGGSWTAGVTSTTLDTVTAGITSGALLSLGTAEVQAIFDHGEAFAGTSMVAIHSALYNAGWGAAQTVLSGIATTQHTSDWGADIRTPTDVHLVARTGTNTYSHRRGNSGTWSAGDAIPTQNSLQGGGVVVRSDGANVWAFVIDTDGANTIRVSKWTSGSGWGAWTAFEGASATRAFLSCGLIAQSTIPILWTQQNGAAYDLYVEALSTLSSGTASFVPGVFTMGASASEPPTANGGFQPAAFTMAATVPAEQFSAAAAFRPAAFTMAATAEAHRTARGGFFLGFFTMAAAASEPGTAVAGFRPGPFLLLAHGTVSFPHTGPLAVTSVTPTDGATATPVVILGAGFLGTTRVMFGPYNSFEYPFVLPDVISDNEIHVTAPESPFYLAGGNHDPQTVDVQVFTFDDPTGSPLGPADEYTLLAPPVVTSVTPNTGSIEANTDVVVIGKNFQHAIEAQLQPFAVGSIVDVDISLDGTQMILTLSTTAFPTGVGTYTFRVFAPAGFSDYGNPFFTVYSSTVVDPTPPLVRDTIAGRYGPVAFRYRFEEHLRDNSFVRDLTQAVYEDRGCTIHLDNTQAVARTAEFVFDEANLPPDFDCGESTTHCVAVYADLTIGGVTYSWQLGLFHLDLPVLVQYPNSSVEWQAKGADLTLILSDRTPRVPYTVPAGADYLQTIKGICEQFGLVTNLPALTTGVAPVAITWPATTTWLTIINDLLFGMNLYPIWADEQGRMTTRAAVDPALEPAAVVYSSLEEPRMPVEAASTRTFTVSTLANWIAVAIDDPSRTPYTASLANNDPSAPTSIVTSNKQNFKAYAGSGTPSTKAVVSPQVADALAAYLLRDENTKAVSRTLETQPDPRRTNREWYQVSLDGFEDATLWRVRKWDLVCATGGPMTHELEFAQSIQLSGPPPVATVVQNIGTVGLGAVDGIVPGQGAILTASVPVTTPTTAGNTIVVAAFFDQFTTFAALSDSAGNVYAATILDPTGFDDGQPGGAFHTVLYTCLNAQPLHAGDTITFTLAVGAHQVCLSAWELGGIDVGLFAVDPNMWAAAVHADPLATNTLFAVDSGASAVVGLPYAVVLGIVGVLWNDTGFDGGAAPGYTVTPDGGEGWDGAPTATVETQPLYGLYAILSVTIQIGLAAGVTYRLSGALSNGASGWAAYAVPLQGVQP